MLHVIIEWFLDKLSLPELLLVGLLLIILVCVTIGFVLRG